jgi:hypothetical protein
VARVTRIGHASHVSLRWAWEYQLFPVERRAHPCFQRSESRVVHMTMMDPDYHGIPPVERVFDCARQFGLTEGEVLRTVEKCLSEVDGDDSVAEFLDQLTGTLARNVLEKEQRTFAEEQRSRAGESRVHPKNRSSSASESL